MKKNCLMSLYGNEKGFALITAIMMLFAATILGLMVMNSSEVEILLSGAQQRYENNLNVTEGAVSVEAAAVGTSAVVTRTVGGTDYTRSYAVENPGLFNQVLSPQNLSDAIFDPGNDRTTAAAYDDGDPDTWPIENLLQSDSAADDPFDYHYRTVYQYATHPPKGYDATKFSGYLFQISAQRSTQIELGGNKVGPKLSM